jgi:hypothetical protein
MNRSLKAAAVIAVMGLLAAVSAGALPRGAGEGRMGGPGSKGPGMMGGRGFDGALGPGGRAPGMMGGGWNAVPGWEYLKRLDKALTVETAKERVASALKDWGYADLVVDTVAAYDDGFYALVKEKTSGKPALEAFVDPMYGTVSAGRGPESSWNTKYGRSLMWPQPSGKTITAEQAKNLVQQWLDRSRDRTAYELKVVELPGYFSVQLQEGGKLSGLVAVNATTSQVWYRGGCGGRFAVTDGSDAG